jgi:hypothetical protein
MWQPFHCRRVDLQTGPPCQEIWLWKKEEFWKLLGHFSDPKSVPNDAV